MTDMVISERLSRATKRYEKLVETSVTTTHAHKRMDRHPGARGAGAA